MDSPWGFSTSYGTGFIALFETLTGARLARLGSHESPVTGLVLSSDGTRLLSSEMKGDFRVTLWDTSDARSTTLPECTGPYAFSPDGVYLACTDSVGVLLWHTRTQTRLRRLRCQKRVQEILFSPDLGTLVTLSGGAAQRWDCFSGALLEEIEPGADASAFGAACFTPDGSHLLLGGTKAGTITMRAMGPREPGG
jgi:WD40 repeat protein